MISGMMIMSSIQCVRSAHFQGPQPPAWRQSDSESSDDDYFDSIDWEEIHHPRTVELGNSGLLQDVPQGVKKTIEGFAGPPTLANNEPWLIRQDGYELDDVASTKNRERYFLEPLYRVSNTGNSKYDGDFLCFQGPDGRSYQRHFRHRRNGSELLIKVERDEKTKFIYITRRYSIYIAPGVLGGWTAPIDDYVYIPHFGDRDPLEDFDWGTPGQGGTGISERVQIHLENQRKKKTGDFKEKYNAYLTGLSKMTAAGKAGSDAQDEIVKQMRTRMYQQKLGTLHDCFNPSYSGWCYLDPKKGICDNTGIKLVRSAKLHEKEADSKNKKTDEDEQKVDYAPSMRFTPLDEMD